MIKQLFIFLFLSLLIPCDKIAKRIINPEPSNFTFLTEDALLNKALKSNNIYFDNIHEFPVVDRFQFFRSGHLLDSVEVNAISVKCHYDTTYVVKLFSLKGLKWQLVDSICNLEAFPWQFNLSFDDYNFDGQVDIYIQVGASNGWSQSSGHLILINPRTNKFELHNEARELTNMKADPYSKEVYSEEFQGYDSLNHPHLTILTNKWINGQLKTINKRVTVLDR